MAGKRSEVLYAPRRIPWRASGKRSSLARLGASGISRCSGGSCPGFILHCFQGARGLGWLSELRGFLFGFLLKALGLSFT